MTQLKGFKWFVYKKVGNNKADDKKVSKGFGREWLAREEMTKIRKNLPKEESNKVKLYINSETQD